MVEFYEKNRVPDSLFKFAVIVSKSNGKWVFCKHRQRNTLECPGGHREPGEDINETAKRELREETGALDFNISPVCAYSVTSPNNFNGEKTYGMIYFAYINSFEKELHSEIEKIIITDSLPDKWTYPDIQPYILDEIISRGF